MSLDAGHDGTLSKFVDDTKLEPTVDCLKGRETLQILWQTRELGNHQLHEVQQEQVLSSAPGMGQP